MCFCFAVNRDHNNIFSEISNVYFNVAIFLRGRKMYFVVGDEDRRSISYRESLSEARYVIKWVTGPRKMNYLSYT